MENPRHFIKFTADCRVMNAESPLLLASRQAQAFVVNMQVVMRMQALHTLNVIREGFSPIGGVWLQTCMH